MMKAIFKKLKSKAGESLVESLAAILIFTMASIVMFSMVTAAGDINGKAKEMDAANQAHMVAVEKGLESAQNGTAKITFSISKETVGASGSTTEVIEIATETVDIYGGEDDSLFTYFIQTGG